MAIDWTPSALSQIEEALRSHPADSGRCAAVARVVAKAAAANERTHEGLLIRPGTAARYLLLKDGSGHRWHHHVVTEVERQAVDVLTGARGHPQDSYLSTYFQFPHELETTPVDVFTVDPGIQEDS
jgi:hypothetical protein